MIRKILESYQSNKRMVARCKKKIEEELLWDIPVVKGRVKGSSPEFPYTERHFCVDVPDPVVSERMSQRIKGLKAEIGKAETEMTAAEKYISDIYDTSAREILTYRFIDGMSVTDIGDRTGYTKGRISQIISKYIKD